MVRDDGGKDAFRCPLYELDMTHFPGVFDEPGRLKSPLDLAIRERLKRHPYQPLLSVCAAR